MTDAEEIDNLRALLRERDNDVRQLSLSIKQYILEKNNLQMFIADRSFVLEDRRIGKGSSRTAALPSLKPLAPVLHTISISGKAYSGKDTSYCILRDLLEKRGVRTVNSKFAEGVKEICSIVTSTPLPHAYERKHHVAERFVSRDVAHGFVKDDPSLSYRLDLAREVNRRITLSKKANVWIPYVPELTFLLQSTDTLGTVFLLGCSLGVVQQKLGEGFRNLVSPNFWVDMTRRNEASFRSTCVVIRTDARYHTEMKDVEEEHQLSIRLEGDPMSCWKVAVGGRDPNHPSETALDDYDKFDFVIHNVAPEFLLKTALERILTKLEKDSHCFAPKERSKP